MNAQDLEGMIFFWSELTNRQDLPLPKSGGGGGEDERVELSCKT
jgi:hypothetical protein